MLFCQSMGLNYVNFSTFSEPVIIALRNLVCSTKQGIALQKLVMGIIYLHSMVFAYGKLLECADRLTGNQMPRIMVKVLIAGIVIIILACHRLAETRCIYEVTLIEGEENAVYKALYDTGNLLTDPVSGKPVSFPTAFLFLFFPKDNRIFPGRYSFMIIIILHSHIKLATYASRCIENEILMYLRRNNKTIMILHFSERKCNLPFSSMIYVYSDLSVQKTYV